MTRICRFWKRRKNAVDIPAEPNNIHITIIWYRAAMSGGTPDKIWPVIMPGSETSPTANNVLTWGMSAACIATGIVVQSTPQVFRLKAFRGQANGVHRGGENHSAKRN